MAKRTMKLLMLPWLAYGHISPLLELAKRLSCRNFTVFLCSTPANLASVRSSIPEEYSSSICLVEVRLAECPDLPPHHHTTKGLPTCLMNNLKRAFSAAGPALLSDIITDVSPDLMIYDGMLWWAPPIAEARGIPAVLLSPMSAAMVSFIVHYLKRPGEKYPFESIYFDPFLSRRNESHASEEIENGVTALDRRMQAIESSSEIVLVRTFRELEGKYMDYFSNLIGKKVVPVGPLVQDFTTQEDENDLIRWLDGKEKSSTVFVSFGTEYFLEEKETEEIAHGLELSDVPFIWVVMLQEGEETTLEHVLPGGFLERVQNRGIVVEKWAPQARILAHPSVGGFMSHCGWGSVMEGMKFGVPIVAVPMHLDQPLNMRVVEEVGVGVEARRDEEGGLNRGEIARVIKDVMFGETGESVRKKAEEISDGIRNRGDDGEEIIDEVGLELVRLWGSFD